MATIKVTYVVDNGSFNEVPAEISNADTVRFTEARMRSKEASPTSFSDKGLKRLSMKSKTFFGVILSTNLLIPIAFRTSEREAPVEEKRSIPSL